MRSHLLLLSFVSATACVATSGQGIDDPPVEDPPAGDPPVVVSPGTATVASQTCARGTGRLAGTTCRTLTIACPEIDDINVEVRVTEPPAGTAVRGTIILGSGGGGRGFSYDQGSIMESLGTAGFRVVQRGWAVDWMAQVQGRGLAAATCRYATLVHWVAANLGGGEAVCASGNSGGAAELGEAITRWNLDAILDQAVPTSGPGLARVDSGCLLDSAWRTKCSQLNEQSSTNPACSYADNGLDGLIDLAYAPATPCASRSSSAAAMLYDDSSLGAGADLELRDMRLDILLGGRDPMITFSQGLVYAAAVQAGAGAEVSVRVIPDAPHALPDDASPGLPVLIDTLTTGCVKRH